MEDLLRFEQRHLLTAQNAQVCQLYVEQILWEDDHGMQEGEKGYMVRSLYFDIPDCCGLQETSTNETDRKKPRLRIYSPGATWAFLELKSNEGLLQRKRSLRITRELAEKMAEGQYDVLLTLQHPFANEIHKLMSAQRYQPRALVEHRRRAFMLDVNNTRVTFDKDVYSCYGSRRLFDEKPSDGPSMDPSLVVMGIKYNRFLLSYVHKLVQMADESAL